MRLEGKVAIVSGNSLNIGTAVAQGFAAEGAKVACNDLSPELAQRSVDKIRAAGGEAIAIPGNVADEELTNSLVQQVLDTWGHIDILVNGANVNNGHGLLDITTEEFRQQIDVTTLGYFFWTRAVATSMIERNIPGSIICIASGVGWQGQPGNIGYSTVKAGVLNFTRAAAMDVAQYGIRVNSFTPTWTTPDDPEVLEEMRSHPQPERPAPKFTIDFPAQMPMGRNPHPSDIVPAFIYLASDESMMVTGTDLTVDGGVRAKYWAYVPHPK